MGVNRAHKGNPLAWISFEWLRIRWSVKLFLPWTNDFICSENTLLPIIPLFYGWLASAWFL